MFSPRTRRGSRPDRFQLTHYLSADRRSERIRSRDAAVLKQALRPNEPSGGSEVSASRDPAARTQAELHLSRVPPEGDVVAELRIVVHDSRLLWGVDAVLEERTGQGWKPLYLLFGRPGDDGEPRTVPKDARNISVPAIGFSGSATVNVFIPALPPGHYRIVKEFGLPVDESQETPEVKDTVASVEFSLS